MEYRSHYELIQNWGYKSLASDTGAEVKAVSMWMSRDRIPLDYWERVVEAAQKHGYPVTIESLYRTRHILREIG